MRSGEESDGARRRASLTLPRRRRGDVLHRRLALVVETLGGSPAESSQALRRQLRELLGEAQPDAVWLALSVLDAAMPDSPTVLRTVRRIRLDGVDAAFEKHLVGWLTWLAEPRGTREVEVLRDGVLVDVAHTLKTGLATGIQRVARQTIQRWVKHPDVVLGSWTADLKALRALGDSEARRALTGASGVWRTPMSAGVVVPWNSTYVLPELAVERERTERLEAMARFARVRTVVVGHDCVPVTSAETVNVGVSGTFIGYLGAVRHMDQVVTVSEASAGEFRGWRHMLSAAGIDGPEVSTVPLPAEVGQPSEEALRVARERFLIGTMPMVLCVGTHEPRKNHLAVLHAADRLWRAGHRFSLMFIGGNGWHSDVFLEYANRLRGQGRPVDTRYDVSDDELWAAYRVARFLVFPSLNEGFGLPVAEALASGLPVVTSRFGSMAEIAAGGGAVLVDPRDDESVFEGLRSLLDDDAQVARLAAAARQRPTRTWDHYAEDLWAAVTEVRS